MAESAIDALDPRMVLEEAWRGWLVPVRNPWPAGTGPLAPFGPAFPGLAPTLPRPDGDRLVAEADGAGRLGLVNCRRPADAVALAGWTGTLLVPRPPVSEDDALRVAVEVAALCPDALWQPDSYDSPTQRECTLEAIARELVREPVWRL